MLKPSIYISYNGEFSVPMQLINAIFTLRNRSDYRGIIVAFFRWNAWKRKEMNEQSNGEKNLYQIINNGATKTSTLFYFCGTTLIKFCQIKSIEFNFIRFSIDGSLLFRSWLLALPIVRLFISCFLFGF